MVGTRVVATTVVPWRHDLAVSDSGALFVFANDDPLPMAFDSFVAAAGYMEPIDVQDGLYSAFRPQDGLRGGVFAVDGRVLEARVVDGAVELQPTARWDATELRRRLTDAARRGLVAADPNDPVSVARELLQQQWDSRWPQRPRWLDRRLHGDTPPTL